MNLRDRFWKAFWRRQKKYLPPTIEVTNCNFEAAQPHIVIKGRYE